MTAKGVRPEKPEQRQPKGADPDAPRTEHGVRTVAKKLQRKVCRFYSDRAVKVNVVEIGW